MNYSLPGLYYYKPRRPQRKFNWIWLALVLVMLLLLIKQVRAGEINLSIIATIESSNNPKAYNSKSGARGLYQITPICLKDYNQWHKGSEMPLISLYNPILAHKVAEWYLSIRIPQMLKAYSIKPCAKDERADLYCWKEIDLQIIAWNWGIGNLVKWYRNGARWNKLPKETQNYIKRYQKLERKK